MRGRPLCGMAIAFTAGISITYWLPFALPPPGLIAILAALLITPCVVFCSAARFRRPAVAMILFVCLGILAGRLALPTLPAPASLEPFLNEPDALVVAEVSQSPDFYPDKVRLPLRLHRIVTAAGCFPVEGGVLLTLKQDEPKPGVWLIGDELAGRMTLKPFHNFSNPGGYNYASNRAESGFYARAYAANDKLLIKLAAQPVNRFLYLPKCLRQHLDRFRQEALLWLKKNEAPDVAAFYAALLLGYRHQLSIQWVEHMNRAGVAHLLAISGLHLGMVSVAIYWLASRLIRLFFAAFLQKTSDRRMAVWAALSFALIYAFIGGLALPTWRASIMLLLVCGAVYWYRYTDSPSLLAAAAMIILIIFPNALRQISFQLSFAAMIGIFLFFPRFQKIRMRLLPFKHDSRLPLDRFFRPFLDAFFLSAAATMTVLPLTAYHFNGVSISGSIANTVLVPLIGLLVLPIGLTSLMVFALNESLAVVLLSMGGRLVACCQHIILWFSDLAWAYIWVGPVPEVYLVWFYAALALLLYSWRWPQKAAALITLTLLAGGYALLTGTSEASNKDRSLQVTAIDVGQGSSTLVRFPTGETMLIDGGGFFDDSFDVGRHVVAPFLWRSGIRKLDYVVLSHDHPDHRNGLRFILSHFDVGSFWETGISSGLKNGLMDGLHSITGKRKLGASRLPQLLLPKTFGPCRLRILHPAPEYLSDCWDKKDLNNISLVLQIEFGETGVIIPGDIDSSVERLLFENHMVPRNLLLISPHHGSANSNSNFLLDRLQPDHLVFSCGNDNLFGFPAAKILAECRRRAIKIHRTDVHGAIMASSNGSEWKIRHYLQRTEGR